MKIRYTNRVVRSINVFYANQVLECSATQIVRCLISTANVYAGLKVQRCARKVRK